MDIKIMDFVVLCLAAYRVTHLLVFDKIVDPVRNYFVKRDFGGEVPTFTLQGGRLRRFIGKLLNCHWCTGIWVAIIMVVLYQEAPNIKWIYLAFAAAAVVSLIETKWMKTVGFPELAKTDDDMKHPLNKSKSRS